MRQVNRDELIHIIHVGMRDWTKTLVNDFFHHDSERKMRARLTAAAIVADKMQRLEILSSGNEPPGFRHINPDAPMVIDGPKPGLFDLIGNEHLKAVVREREAKREHEGG